MVIGSLYLLHAGLRTAIGGSVRLDEAEMLLLTQDWRWGYHSQPPLYPWLQALVFAVTGPGIAGLALLKSALLAAVPAFLAVAARAATGSMATAPVAAAAVYLLPLFTWESHRDQTHLVLATAVAAATLWIWARLLAGRRTLDYALFGLVVALGLHSKYNYLLLPAALLLAALSLPAARGVVLDRRMALALGLALGLSAPHLLWALGHPALVTAQSHRLVLHPPGATAALLGLGGLLEASLVSFAPLLLIAFVPYRGRGEEPRALLAVLLGRAVGVGLVLAGLGVVAAGVTSIEDRWLQPLAVAAPLVVACDLVEPGAARRRRLVMGLGAALAVAALAVLHGTAWWGVGAGEALHHPYDDWARQIRARGFEGGRIVAGSKVVGGNLRLRFPGSPVATPDLPAPTAAAGSPCLVVWNARRAEAVSAPPARLAPRVGEWCRGAAPAPSLAATQGSPWRLGYYVLRDEKGDTESWRRPRPW
jgi:hypothetical protein